MAKIHFRIKYAFFLSKVLGLTNFQYNKEDNFYERNQFLLIYSLILTIVVRLSFIPFILVLVALSTYLSLSKASTVSIQENILLFFNEVLQYLFIFFVYANHFHNRNLQIRILNHILKIDKQLERLTKKKTSVFKDFSLMKLQTATFDIVLIVTRPFLSFIVVYEAASLSIFFKLTSTALFLEWQFINCYLITACSEMNDFFCPKYVRMRVKDYRRISQICNRIYKVKQLTNDYYGSFLLMSYMELFRVISFMYFWFSCLLYNWAGAITQSFCLKPVAFVYSGCASCSSMVDIFVFGLIGDTLLGNAEILQLKILINRCGCGVKRTLEFERKVRI